jgi:cell division protein FtsZ
VKAEFKNARLERSSSGTKIRIIGVGGGGGSVINRMVGDNLIGVQYIAANTDMMVLNSSKADLKIELGQKITHGLGTGMRPDIGKAAAKEAINHIKSALKGCDLVFIVVCLGGGTGTGAAPVIAEAAKTMGILTIAILTTPFSFEGSKRYKLAEEGLAEIKKVVDTFIVVHNNSLLEVASPRMAMEDAFIMADDVLKQGIHGILNLINQEGAINLDIADLKTALLDRGSAVMGIGRGYGNDRGLSAAKDAISSHLLASKTIAGGKGVIINIVADKCFALLDVNDAVEFIRTKVDEDADIIFGLVYDEEKRNEVSITVIVAGLDQQEVKNRSTQSNHRHLRIV